MRRLSLLIIIPVFLLAVAPSTINPVIEQNDNVMGEVSNDPAGGILIWWASGGNVENMSISNCLQTSYVERTYQYQNTFYTYEQVAISDGMLGTGKILEYPAGSNQFYNYTAGFWFGAMYPREIDGGDTTWFPSVSKGGPYGDLGAMSVPEMEEAGGMGNLSFYGLNFSQARIAEGYPGEGSRLFAPHGAEPGENQVLWPFADTLLNQYRSGDELDPTQGDQVSHDDSYAVGGDWIPAEQAANFWVRDTILPSGDTLGPYGVHGLGIRVEQRTYAWFSGNLVDAIVFDYKIRNMNDYPLKAPYFGFFMDNDIGSGGSTPGSSGAWDDAVGFDAGRDLAYTYDGDGTESGWDPPPGYLGLAYLNTPGDAGLSGIVAWEYDTASDADNVLYAYFDGYEVDSSQYAYMANAPMDGWDSPSDVRMLPCSGPYPDMEPNEEHTVTMAIVMGDDLADLQANVDALNDAFSQGLPWIGIEESADPVESATLELSSLVTDGLVTLHYSAPVATDISLSVFDASGRLVEVLVLSANQGTLSWDAAHLTSGVYFIRLTTEHESVCERVVVIK